jgi:large subunit ribosomal protein L25
MFVVLKAVKRENFGSSAAKKIRRKSQIPAIIYSKGGNINLSLDSREFEHEYSKGIILTSVVELEFDDKKITVITHKVELDPVSDRPIHIDFLHCEDKKVIRARPQLVFTNQEKSPGLKKSGFLHIVLRRVEVICDNINAVPNKIEIDAGLLHIGYKIRANDLILPKGVKLAKKENFLIGSIIGRGKSEEEKAAVTTTAEGTAATDAAPLNKAEEKKPEKKPEKK